MPSPRDRALPRLITSAAIRSSVDSGSSVASSAAWICDIERVMPQAAGERTRASNRSAAQPAMSAAELVWQRL